MTLVLNGSDTSAGDDAGLGYTSAEGIIITGQGTTSDVTIKNDADATVISIPTGTTNVDIVGVATATTFEPDGDTSSGDNAAIGYTSAEGLILTGQGTTSDVTIKNDADATVLSIPTGTTKVGIGLTNPTGQFAVSDGTRIAEINPHSSGTFIGNRSNHDVLFQVNASEKMRIDTSGKVGVGTSANLTGYVNLPESDYGEGFNWFSSGTAANRGGVGHYSYESRIYYGSSDNLTFVDGGPSGTERMRIDASGNLLVGTTNTSLGIGNTNTGFQVENNGTFLASRADQIAGSLNRNNDGTILSVRRSGNEVGTLGVTSSSTSYNTSSDYRLKENVSYTFDATTRLKQLKPARFNFIADSDNTVDGFLAHEVSSIVPEAITGTKDQVNSDGDPIYQVIDQSKLVPLLVKTIQELEARITALEAG